tara:strand:+ start:5303 stop:5950 length:648 start_codon:yes stop_codon:yes gene_type:complete
MSICPEIILMARWPAPNRCKNRLSQGIGIERAANIQKELTNHTISVAKAIQRKGLAEISLSISGLGPKASKRWGKESGINKVLIQGSGSLGLRMRRTITKCQSKTQHFSRKTKETIVIGTDLPTLCQLDLIEALEIVKNNEIVLGPSNDGGYWLIGLGEKYLNPLISWPFSGIPWGTNEVLKTTLKSAEREGIKVNLLRQQNDLDNIEDLKPWIR